MRPEPAGVCDYETSHSTIRNLRAFFWAVMLTGPPGLAAASFLTQRSLGIAMLMLVGGYLIMLLNGFRTVIGVRLYGDRLQIITPLAEPEFRWDRVRVKKYPAFCLRTDIYVSGKLWPFMWGTWGERARALRAIEQHKRLPA